MCGITSVGLMTPPVLHGSRYHNAVNISDGDERRISRIAFQAKSLSPLDITG